MWHAAASARCPVQPCTSLAIFRNRRVLRPVTHHRGAWPWRSAGIPGAKRLRSARAFGFVDEEERAEMAPVTSETIRELRAAIGGKVHEPGESGYDEAVNIWNAASVRRPGVVASCTSSADVAAALTIAAKCNAEVSVRGGGHNYAGFALTDGGVMIDLSPMKAIAVDAATKRARCGGGTTWGELDA